MTLLATGISELVATTLRDLGRAKITDLTSDLQRHTALRQLTKKNRVEFQSGYGIQWSVMVNHSGSFQNVGLGAVDDVNIVDTTVQATTDWRNSTTNWALIAQVIAMNRDPARIVDMVRLQRYAALVSMAEGMENNFWGPPVASSDEVTPYGVNMWIVKNATEGFNGGAPSGFTSIGLNPTTYPRWKNWTAQYTTVSDDDLIRKWRKAATFTDFEPPIDGGVASFNTGNNYGFFTNYGVLGPLEELLKQSNENLGNDLAKYDGDVIFRRVPVKWVPKLEADTTNPVYGINWGVFKTIILKDWWMHETHIPNYPGQHNIEAHFLDSTYNWVTYDRRRHFVLATGTTYPS